MAHLCPEESPAPLRGLGPRNVCCAPLHTDHQACAFTGVAGAHATPDPTLERTTLEDGILLELEWFDRSSGWHLYVAVKRKYGEKPRVTLDFSGNPEHYGVDNPTDTDISKALRDYFESWKKS